MDNPVLFNQLRLGMFFIVWQLRLGMFFIVRHISESSFFNADMGTYGRDYGPIADDARRASVSSER